MDKLDAIDERLAALARSADLTLSVDAQGLFITDGTMSVRGDFAHMTSRIKPANLGRELIVRAAKTKGASPSGERGAQRVDPNAATTTSASEMPPHRLAVDATAGLGEDSLLLAAAGFEVYLFERNPVIAALLRDAVERARAIPELHEAACRMQVTEGDSIAALRALPFEPDVVLLDPMFPAKQKHAAVKKKLQLLQRLESPCEDEGELLEAAISAHPRKIVIKRPIKGPHLAGRIPSYSLAGKAIRYDCIAFARPASGKIVDSNL